MIRFMVLAAPRSGTAWAANWLTTDQTLCLHDPLFKHHYEDLDRLQSAKTLGVACTGLVNFTRWLNDHPARKVILHRPVAEVNASLQAVGLPVMPEGWERRLDNIDGHHCHWRDLFERPQFIYEHLLQRPFDRERHNQLRELEVQRHFEGIVINKDATARLLAELEKAAHPGAIQ